MYLSFPDCNPEDYSYLHHLFLNRNDVSSWRRFFPVFESTWHLEGLAAAMQTDKRDIVQAGLLKNPRWMNRDLPKLLETYFELEKVDKEAADSLLATIKEGCNTNAFVTAYFKAQRQEEKDLIKSCFQGAKTSLFDSSTLQAIASGNANDLGQALCREISKGCTKEMVSLLIERGADINTTLFNIFSESHGRTPLMIAIARNQTKIATLLLQQPTPPLVNYLDILGNTALMYAIQYGNEEIVEELLNNPTIDVNRSNGLVIMNYPDIQSGALVIWGTGTSPLMLAASKANRKNIMSMLLKHPNIDVNYRDAWGRTALINATREQEVANVAQLLEEASNLDASHGLEYIKTSLFFPNKDIYSLIYEKVDINKACIWALKKKRFADVKRFLPFVNVDFECPKTGNTLLIAALRSNCMEAVEHLMPLVDVNKLHPRKKDHPLRYASNEGTAALLLSPYPLTFSYTQDSPFCHCIHGKKEKLESWLLRNPKKVNAVDAHGNTLLHYATAKGHMGIVSLLLSQPGIDPNLKNGKGNTPLHIAIRNGQEEGVKLLVSHEKIDLNLKNKAEDTPLSLAARLRRDSCLEALIRKGAEIDPLAIALSTQALVDEEPSSALVSLIAASKTRRILASKNKAKLG